MGEIPAEFLDSLMYTLMKNLVIPTDEKAECKPQHDSESLAELPNGSI